ncbi:MAG TPA: allantoate amidohydrolase [Candidatus Acidoferrales bacterium]|jgi:allantoate deiminase|nr:allantoate amidohydrolase [Candidatus Acidoferrales bacterium]
MQQSVTIADRAEKVIARCKRLASVTEVRGSTCRTFLSIAMRECYRVVGDWMEAAGAEVSIDAAGNLRGFYPAEQSNAPRLLLGSHLDTVPNAGAYDGVLGVVLAVSLLETLEDRRLPFAIEVIGFSEEEGIRFGTPFIGSRALVGKVDDELLKRTDTNGVSVRTAIENFGLKPAQISKAAMDKNTLAYLEFHIEQGPVLESLGIPLGVVEGIAGQTRAECTFLGSANHAGTTPMNLRHDAMSGAAEWILEVERVAKREKGLVATVGRAAVTPNAANVIAGQVRLSLDLRHKSNDVRTRAAEFLAVQAEEIAHRRGLTVERKTVLNQPAVSMDSFLTNQIEQAAAKIGCKMHRMFSGAGHDAMILAGQIPTGMIFLRTPSGISHHPSESVGVEDVAKAMECGMLLLAQLAGSAEFQKRMVRA